MPRLRAHGASTQYATPGAGSLGRAFELDGAYAIAQLREHCGGGAKFGRQGEPQLQRIGHRAVGPEEVQGAGAAAGDQVELTRKHLAREHALASYQDLCHSLRDEISHS